MKKLTEIFNTHEPEEIYVKNCEKHEVFYGYTENGDNAEFDEIYSNSEFYDIESITEENGILYIEVTELKEEEEEEEEYVSDWFAYNGLSIHDFI